MENPSDFFGIDKNKMIQKLYAKRNNEGKNEFKGKYYCANL